MMNTRRETVIEVRGLGKRFGERWVLENVDLDLYQGEILALVGASGSGKTTLLRQIIGLSPLDVGSVRVFGQDVHNVNLETVHEVRRRWGVLFQQGALFSALTVFDNIAFPLRELAVTGDKIDEDYIRDLVMLKLEMVGLEAEAARKLPSELSGGMVKRAALARALALDAEILFLDEPTTGLDPNLASEFDHLLLELKSELQLSALMVTHDPHSVAVLGDRVAVLGGGKLKAIGPTSEVAELDDPFIQSFFHGERGKLVFDNMR